MKLKRRKNTAMRSKLKRTSLRRLRGKKLSAFRRSRQREALQQQIAASHTRGYQEGYEDGRTSIDSYFEEGYEKGYKDGVFSGGDGIVDSVVDFDLVLPETPVQDIIRAGVEALRPRGLSLMNASQVTHELEHAMNHQIPFSVVRLGDGELLTLAQEAVMSIDDVKREGHFLSYAGVEVPDFEARDALLQAVRGASIVGIPKLRNPNFQPLAFSVFRTYGLDYRSMKLTHSLINYYMYTSGSLRGMLNGRRVLVVGNLAPQLKAAMDAAGFHVVGTVTPVHGVKDVNRIMGEIHRMSFDIALVAAGIAAVIISQRIAAECGKVAVDFGHLADSIARGEAPL